MAKIKIDIDGSQAIDEIVTPFGKLLVQDLREALKKNGVTYGGGQESRLAANIRYEVIHNNDSITFQLFMPDYSYWVDKGRKRGGVSKEGQEKIKTWAKRKGLVGKYQNSELIARQKNSKSPKKSSMKKLSFDKAVEQLTYLITRKVARSGYKGNKFFTSTISDGRLDKFEEQLTKYFGKQINIDINDNDFKTTL